MLNQRSTAADRVFHALADANRRAVILAPWERRPNADFGNDPEILHADIPSVGTATARGLAAMYARQALDVTGFQRV